MEVQREHFDELLGGKQQLPTAVSIIKFANARSQEIAALTEAIEEPQNKHLAFQRMSKHLRRRAMSHNIKRMPRRLREVHLAQLEKSGLPTKGKRPSRKYRRRPKNLLQEYNRRQRHAVWLETHIWHAKRFHMVEQWGYKLPNITNDKAFRACYRATAKHCLIQDLSYLNCIELKGTESNILQGLNQLTSTECGLTFAAKANLSGNREGTVTVFRNSSYPSHAIGKVTFMWCPQQGLTRKIWIWCHPAFCNEFLNELISVFKFIPEKSDEMEADSMEDVKDKVLCSEMELNKNIETVKLIPKNIGKLPKYSNGNVTMILLKDTLNRFRLTGPLAQIILTEALKFVEINKFLDPQSKQDVVTDDKLKSVWLSEFYNSEANLLSLQQQKLFWENCLPNVNSADELPPRMILAATVSDPRLSMPSSRTKAINETVCTIQVSIPENLSRRSPLWDENLRDRVTCSKMTNSELNKLKGQALVPGLANTAWLGRENIAHLPLLLIQNPGIRGEYQQGYGSGWDLIAPSGWGMPLWLGLVYRGARPGGLRETERLSLEMASGPILAPDTKAGCQYSDKLRSLKLDKYFRLPPDKRPNYIKLGVAAPFHCPWNKLIQDWSPEYEIGKQVPYVIRSRLQLDFLRSLFNKKISTQNNTFSDSDKIFGLVLVGVEACGRGKLYQGAMICAPSKKDFKLLKDKYGRGPSEPLHEDSNHQTRKVKRSLHLQKLKRLKRQRVRAKRMLEEKGIFQTKTKTKANPTDDLIKKQIELMRELWLPSKIESIKNSSSRTVMGFVEYGDYSFTHSRCFGYGFVALSALLNVLDQNQNYFLVRNISSLQYYFVRLKVLNPV